MLNKIVCTKEALTFISFLMDIEMLSPFMAVFAREMERGRGSQSWPEIEARFLRVGEQAPIVGVKIILRPRGEEEKAVKLCADFFKQQNLEFEVRVQERL